MTLSNNLSGPLRYIWTRYLRTGPDLVPAELFNMWTRTWTGLQVAAEEF